jgi:hypothetical protein
MAVAAAGPAPTTDLPDLLPLAPVARRERQQSFMLIHT